MRISRRFLLFGLVIGLLFLGLFWVGRTFWFKPQPRWITAKVEKGTIRQTVSASGKIKAQKEVNLQFQTSSKLAWVGVKEGDRVTAWQAIAQLDRQELEKNLEKALRDYAKERNDFEEESRITYRGQTPQTALTDTIKRILEKNQWDLEKAVLDVELKDLALKYATLVTPISGIVTRLDAPVAGVNIVYTTTIFTVSDPNSVIFSAQVDEADISQLREGQEVALTLDAYPEEEITGNVSRIAFSSMTTSGGGTAFPIEITLPENINERFKIGMNGDAEIVIAQKGNVLIIPAEALKKVDGKSVLRIPQDGKEQEIEVAVGLTNDTEAEIVKGVREEETIIISETE